MHSFTLDLNSCPAELRRGLGEIKADYPTRFTASSRAQKVVFVKDSAREQGGLAVVKSPSRIVVKYGRKTDAFRALGRLMGEEGPVALRADFTETPQFDMLGVMVDCSRNGVLRPDMTKVLLRRWALMGLNMCMLYTEDTYEVPDEPFFGYLRGCYTWDELKDLDAYAEALGIEMIPCIQTLGHLEQILQWPAYAGYRDTAGVILANDDKTYILLEKMIDAATAPFHSRRIHIGMDEAHGIGTGRYRAQFGDESPFAIINRHLKRVRSLCRKLGVRPMIWSDMYFRLGSKTNDYYDRASKIPRKVVAGIPRDVDLVYWDYYHTEVEFYEEWIDRHRSLGSEPIMAGGVWTWNHFWAALPFSFTTTEAAMRACKNKKLRQAFTTLWGDDGMECDLFSALPGIQFFAEHGYADRVDDTLLRANFRGICNAEFDTWVKVCNLDQIPEISNPKTSHGNASKWLLWQDPLLSIFDPLIKNPPALQAHYEKLAETLLRAARRAPANRRLLFPALVARTVALKCNLRRELALAYRAGNHTRLWQLTKDVKVLNKAVAKLRDEHCALWLSLYKPFGLEVLECRYGGLQARLDGLINRIDDYLKGRIRNIPELAAKLEPLSSMPAGDCVFNYDRAATPSVIK
ncbi:MAG: beta-N-acetylhexosaminidase [Verrucomicrobia bacterium]|nr:beta-N-acetylhexosaminidase [Verrucomicrobiota bacterium]MBU1735745.1 beta-N-acetylhexosaminidase [Verrucomicrobiota bacterium]MBU1855798.1 beta-N-acetylhexosaminidase [Verrucomicrobiota bacterium]